MINRLMELITVIICEQPLFWKCNWTMCVNLRLVVKHLFVSAQTHLWPDFLSKTSFSSRHRLTNVSTQSQTVVSGLPASLAAWKSLTWNVTMWSQHCFVETFLQTELKKLDSNFLSRRIFFCFKAVNYWWINRLTLGSVQLYHTQVEDFSLLRQVSC